MSDRLTKALAGLLKMRSPSVSQLLRSNGYGYEANIIEELEKAAADERRRMAARIDLRDSTTEATVQATIEADEHGINIGFLGYGDHASADGFGRPVFIEFHDARLTIHVWTDIREEDPTHVLSLENARDNRRED